MIDDMMMWRVIMRSTVTGSTLRDPGGPIPAENGYSNPNSYGDLDDTFFGAIGESYLGAI